MGQNERRLLGSTFGSAATAYAEHRPDYAQAAVGWALERAPGPRVLDLGAGTGKLTATLVALGAEVIAVEPDPAMLTKLRRALPTVRALAGSAEAVPLPDASVDAVLAGNAMHWFDMNVAGPEIARVLEPDGILAGLWNVFDNRVDWVAGLERISGSAAIGPRDLFSNWRAETAEAHLPGNGSGRPVRLAGAGRVLAWTAPDRRLPRRNARNEGGDAGHGRRGTRGHARPDPRFPREQTGGRSWRIHPPDADRCAPRRATVKSHWPNISTRLRGCGDESGARARMRECHQRRHTTRRSSRQLTLAQVDVRAESTSDWSAVRAVHLAAFGAHRQVVGNLVDDLRDAVARGEGLSLVAEERDQILGHVLFSPSLLDAPKRLLPVQVLSPIGVVPASQKQGVGTALIRRGIELLIERNVPLVFLEGPPAYYSRFGFQSATDLGFTKPSLRIPDAAFQVLRLPTYEPWMTGTLVYAEAFWRHDAVGLRDPEA